MSGHYFEIESISQMQEEAIVRQQKFSHCAFQNIDFSLIELSLLEQWHFDDCLFLGCRMSELPMNMSENCLQFPSLKKPYNLFRSALYDAEELYEKRENGATLDSEVYAHYLQNGKQANDIGETLSRTLHYHSIIDALHDFLAQYAEKDVVAIMGGHAMKRTDKLYRKVVAVAKLLTQRGKLIVTGGGPGAMEAAHLGAWLAGRLEKDVEDAMQMLSVAPSFNDEGWQASAFEVRAKYSPSIYKSLSIPTWFYGHEPSTPFATHIAKLFDNALREDGLLAIAKGGIVYSPGSAGTLQEIFQDAAQNHYLTFGYSSPMVFLDKSYWTQTIPVYKLLETMVESQQYRNLILSISDDVEEIATKLIEYH